MAITVYFVRHGQTYLNLFHRMQGWADAPLTDKGRKDAARAGEALKDVDFDYLFSSDLKRTVDTAKILLAHHPSTKVKAPMPDPAFREVFFGYFEGVDTQQTALMVSAPNFRSDLADEIRKAGTDHILQRLHDVDPYHQAESPAAFWKRFGAGLDGLRRLPDGKTVVVVCHGMVINCMANRYGNQDSSLVGPDNGSISKFTLTKDSTKLDFYNKLSLPE